MSAHKTAWTNLFDIGQAEHVHYTLTEMATGSRAGRETTELDSLPFMKYLLEPLRAYMFDKFASYVPKRGATRSDFEAAMDFERHLVLLC